MEKVTPSFNDILSHALKLSEEALIQPDTYAIMRKLSELKGYLQGANNMAALMETVVQAITNNAPPS